ncbi:MAG: aldo/keto reductase [Planctomycetes bacterium]|nr:aldo/keto reductase [Planctomycetota bacterium]NOG55140.1 aldo/keto reductase [Planctomycetota bacterium]
MDQRPIGSSDIRVSAIGLGTVKFGRNTNVKYPHAFALPDDSAIVALLNEARELGINLVDTSPAYGTSEARLGTLIPGAREDWVIVSKAGECYSDGCSTYDFSPQQMHASVKRSLQRLRTEYLDAILIHSDGSDCAIVESSGALEALQELKRSGMVRLVGMSTKTVAGGLAAVNAGCDVLMVEYSVDNASQQPVLDACTEAGAGVLVKKALGSGRLVDGPSSSQRPGESLDPGRALRPILSQPAVSSIIVGTINIDHLRQNVQAIRQD